MKTERKEYLVKLGAKARRIVVPKEVVAQVGKKKPPRIEQGEARRYRFAYTKTGPSAYLAHLDLIRALPRSFRRVGLPLFYSSGFHPKPEMTFGPALSLGVFSIGEVVDVKMTDDIDPAGWLEALSESSPDGLRFLGAVRLGANDPSISKVIDAQRYAVAMPRRSLEAMGGRAWLEDRVKQSMAAESLPVVRKIDGIGKPVDVRAFLRTIETHAEESAVREAGLVGDLATMRVDVRVSNSGGVKINEVMEVVAPGLDFQAVRVAMGKLGADGEIMSPLVLAPLRVPRSSALIEAASE